MCFSKELMELGSVLAAPSNLQSVCRTGTAAGLDICFAQVLQDLELPALCCIS